MIGNLQPMTAQLPPETGRQCRAFLCIRDEADRLPQILSHYRDLGVAWFVVVDNGSVDGTLEYLRAQPDCTVFTTTDSFAEARFGMDWINALIGRFGIGHWCLFVDADELLVYPRCEEIRLPEFCAYLEQHGYEGIYAFMMDMYSAGPIAEAACVPGRPFLEACPLHDTDYEFHNRLTLPFTKPRFPAIEVVGGPRLRHFYPEFRDAGLFRYALPRGLTKLRDSAAGRALGLHRWLGEQASPPLLSKVPLILGGAGRHYVSNHRTVPLRLAPVTGVLLHFKFFADFHRRAVRAVEQGQHFDGGTEYGRYVAAVRADPGLCLAHAGSQRYRSSAELVAAGLLRDAADYARFVAGRDRPQAQVTARALPAEVG